MTKKEALSLRASARAAGFEAAIGQLCRGQWYLSVRHRTKTHWAFTALSRRDWDNKMRATLDGTNCG